jgi:transposase
MTQAPAAVPVAGIDIGKHRLDIAVPARIAKHVLANNAAGHRQLCTLLAEHGVTRVGLEATGGYERELVRALDSAGFEVIVLQPRQVRGFALFKLRLAKSDSIDAAIIAECAAAHDGVRLPRDQRLEPLREHLTVIEQIEEDISRNKIRSEHISDPRLKAHFADEITRLKALRRSEIKQLLARLRQHDDLAHRLCLIASIQGIGERTALTLVIRMPELGKISKQQAAALIGVAPILHQSGQYKGQSRIGGGRARPRTALFAATQAACRQWNPQLIAFYNRLIKAGKHHRAAVVACARKLLIFVNTVLARNTPWQPNTILQN